MKTSFKQAARRARVAGWILIALLSLWPHEIVGAVVWLLGFALLTAGIWYDVAVS